MGIAEEPCEKRPDLLLQALQYLDVFRICLFQSDFHVILIGWGWGTFSAVLHMCFWNVLDFTENMELLCVAKMLPAVCRLTLALERRSHFYCRPYRGCSQRRTRWKHTWNHLESLGCMEKFVHNLQWFPALLWLLWFAGWRPGKKVSGALKQAAQGRKGEIWYAICNILQRCSCDVVQICADSCRFVQY